MDHHPSQLPTQHCDHQQLGPTQQVHSVCWSLPLGGFTVASLALGLYLPGASARVTMLTSS